MNTPPLPSRFTRLAFLLLTVWLLGLSDLTFTLWAHRFTPFHELNPFIRPLLLTGHLHSLILIKILLTLLGTTLFWLCRHRRSAELATWLVLAAYILLACQWSTYTQAAMTDIAINF